MLGKTMSFLIDSPINAMSVSRDGQQLAIAGRSLLKVYSLSSKKGTFGNELFNLRSSNLKNLNFSNNDVTWNTVNEGILATAATNGAVVIWNLHNSTKSKIDNIFNDHKRTVNKVSFHNSDPNLVLSGSQDGCMKLFDLRRKEASYTFVSNSESVRDVQFSPQAYSSNHFASVQETGNVEIWDIRRTDKPETSFIAHDGPVFACEWHPNQESNKWLATGGRDKTIKIWDLSHRNRPLLKYNVHTIATVSKLKWRPTKDFHIGSCSLVVDFSVYVWDIQRPYVPYAIFSTRKDVTTGFAWKNDPFVFISSCKDGTVYQHRFETDAYYPAEHYSPIGLDLNPCGNVVYSMTDFIYRYSQQLTPGGRLTSRPKKIIKANSSVGNVLMNSPNGIPIGDPTLSMTTSQNSLHQLSSSYTGQDSSMLLSTSASDKLQNRIMYPANHAFLNSPFYTPTSSSNHSSLAYSSQNGGSNQTLTALPPLGSALYNIGVPISYKKTAEPVLSEHFRCMVSYMMSFPSAHFADDNFRNYMSMTNFVDFAKFYKFNPKNSEQNTPGYQNVISFEELCEHNGRLAENLNCHQIAQTWRIIRHMFSSGSLRHASSGAQTSGGGNNPSGSSITNKQLSEAIALGHNTADIHKIKSDNPSRHTSGGNRHFSGNIAGNQSVANLLGNVNNVFANNDESDDDELREINERASFPLKPIIKQTSMPSNKFSVDFFDTNTIIDSTNFQGINCEPFNLNNDDYELQRESILHRHNINEMAMSQMNDFSQNPGGDSGNQNDPNGSPVSMNGDDDEDGSHKVPIFNANMKCLVATKVPPPPVWACTETITDMLRHHVDIGDVQTAVSIILVMGDKMKQMTSINKETVNVWFRSYLDLLSHFQMWNQACTLMKLSPDPAIQSINQNSTSVLVACARCKKLLRSPAGCDKCKLETGTCCICHVSVHGMYTWCQGCAHGGHMNHMLEWFRSNTLCPAGCGHHCEMC